MLEQKINGGEGGGMEASAGGEVDFSGGAWAWGGVRMEASGRGMGSGVSEVAFEAGEFGAFDGGMGEDGGELGLGHGGDVFAGEGEDGGAREEFGDVGGDGVAVVGTDLLADVAAVDVGAVVEVFGAAVFDGAVAEATGGDEGAVGVDGAGGALA